ncbi:hypothetical protein E8E11_001137 [Didymella keratinophila]|nr:hypothetical protein E8E11_001137 [Didymella keratinophila]
MAPKKLFANRSSLNNSDKAVTSAATLTLKQSLWPLTIVTIMFFLWSFAYGLLDTLNKHFQVTLAGVYQSFGGFCGAIFIIGSELGSLETAANPFIVACGPPRYAESRINVSQTMNAVGTIVGPLLGSYVFFTGTQDIVQALKSVQFVYLGIARFVFLLAGVFFFSSIPEISDADMEAKDQEALSEGNKASFWKQYRLFHAAFTQFCYIGAQVAIAGHFINYVVETRPGSSTASGSKFLSGAQGAFGVGRVLGTVLMKFVRPRYVLLAFMAGATIFLAPAAKTGDNVGVSFMFLILFFESICFLTMPHSFFAAAVTYPTALNFVASYRIPADATTDSSVGLAGNHRDENGSNVEHV